ncbi:hypothetical protein GCM10008018_45230 [Paenibacillus marchantiophytorum]|uniref:DUF2515 domain-containing protein n=1 Tax=Paenibacillus marchantiophytorum TaxID=1619310 RepID=A0ABQ1F005_9BACL|nr:hypothetical protein [Paenibacillus marchantiophytorum]GFZ93768.1 hypothetical protein GCM10008018_45230 [Paenibacillus marchantiophytorum]
MSNIKLAIERFWIEPGNFEMWCDALSKIPLETKARNVKELAKLYFNRDTDSTDKKLDRSKELFGLIGYNYSKTSRQLDIKGMYFLERKAGCLCLTQDAVELIDAYRQGYDWEKKLALQLLSYSPRTRVIMFLLLNGGVIQSYCKSMNELGKWQIVYDGVVYSPFTSNFLLNDMNRMLHRFKLQALGPFWKQVIEENGIILEDEWQFIGSSGIEPAIHNLTAFMRCPMQLFDYLEWFVEMADGTRILNINKISNDIDVKKLFNLEITQTQSELQWLKNEAKNFADHKGLFPIEPVFEQLMAKYYPTWEKGLPRFIDYYITTGISERLFVLVQHESGQPRHGRGYLGKREYQLIKLDFNR